MKIPLRYQMTEYDCGPTSLLNGLNYLFEREEIPPEIVRNIMLYCLDTYGPDGHSGKSGTSQAAMTFLSGWLDCFGKTGHLNITSQYLRGRCVQFGPGSKLRSALRRGGVAVVRLFLECWHYVLLTGLEDDWVSCFDPYWDYDTYPPEEIQVIHGHEMEYNRKIATRVFERETLTDYAFGPIETREAVLMFNTQTVLPEEEAVEISDYVI